MQNQSKYPPKTKTNKLKIKIIHKKLNWLSSSSVVVESILLSVLVETVFEFVGVSSGK